MWRISDRSIPGLRETETTRSNQAKGALLPLLFVGNLCFLALEWLYRWFSQFELGKKISSEIFKKRLEEANEGKDVQQSVLPEDYLNLFTKTHLLPDDIRVSLSRSPLKSCISTINNWLKDKSNEDLLLLYGN